MNEVYKEIVGGTNFLFMVRLLKESGFIHLPSHCC